MPGRKRSSQAATDGEPAAAPGARPPAGSPWWAHVLVSLLTAVVCVLWLWRAGDLDLGTGTISRPSYSHSAEAVIEAITPSPWLEARVRRQYKANLARIRKQLNGSLPKMDASFDIQFASPIYRVNLRDIGIDPGPVAAEVARVVLREYKDKVESARGSILEATDRSNREREERDKARLARDKRRLGTAAKAIEAPSREGPPPDGGSEEDGDTSAFNDAFFVWQSEEGGWDKMFRQSAVMAQVKAFWAVATDNFLRSVGDAAVFDGTPRSEQPAFHAWATVHRECVYHGSHQHGEDVMSGVFYAKMPPDAGTISFFDPRGMHAPMTNRIVVRPREGDIVLFPSTLVHQVSPTAGHSERVSIAVNVLGQDKDVRGSEAMPANIINPTDNVAVPDVFDDDLYTIE